MEDILIPIAVCVVLPVMIVWLVTRSKNQIVNRKMDVLIKAIENGQDIDPELLSDAAGHDAKKRSVKMRLLRQLCWGVILVIAGAGILAGAPFAEDSLDMFIFGGILAAIGVALLVMFLVGRKWLAPEIEAEEKRSLHESSGASAGSAGDDDNVQTGR